MDQSQSNHHREIKTKSSSDEEGEDRNDDQLGIGRSYECVFCKRGFTTAQALGGHMNIHRKDRVNNKPRPSSSPNPSLVTSVARKEDQHVGRGCYPSPSFATPPEVNASNYRSYFPVPTWRELCAMNNYPVSHNRSLFSVDDHDCRSGLSLGIGRSANDDYQEEEYHHNKKEIEGSNRACSSEGDDGLDLELRLGHDP